MADTPAIFNVVLGTAGHIDHGKSTLVQALTGIHPDRLKEEQERGITIDLGFAPLLLSSGLRVGIIDVPGHERFIKNMVAGATGIDFVMMVVAADDGVMAQTREHLQIVELLGVRDGLTVITKKDLVDASMLELVADDIRALEQGTVLEGKPVLAVSAKSGEGLDALKRELEQRLAKLERKPSRGPFRMPIQRVFSKEGFGTVVTGVPLSGEVKIGDTLEVLPPGFSGRVKGLHAYKTVIAHGRAGHSTAVNLYGNQIEKQTVVRGMVAATPGVFRPTKLLTARLNHLPGVSWPLRHRAAVRFHAGTCEIHGKVLLLDGETLAAGQSGWVQVLLEEPAVLAPGDRFILRHQTPMVTLGGGIVVDVRAEKRPRQRPEVAADLQARLAVVNEPAAFVAQVLASAGVPRTLEDVCAERGLLPSEALALIKELVAAKKAVVLRTDALFAAPQVVDALAAGLNAALADFFREHPALGSVEKPELRRRFELRARGAGDCFDDLLALLQQRGQIQVNANDVAPAKRERKLEGALAEAAQKAELAFKQGELAPPAPADVCAQLKLQPKTFKEILKYLVDTRRVVEAAPEFVFHTEPFERARAVVLELLAKQGECSVSEIRQLLGMNRKYVVPLVEALDRLGVTRRVGDKRQLAQKPAGK